MADDETMEPGADLEPDDEAEEPDELKGPDLDVVDLEVDELDADELDDTFVDTDDEADAVDEEDEEAAATAGPVRRAATVEEEDDDDEMLAPDDVEADLDTILKDRMVAAEDEVNEDEEEPEERGSESDRLQPKRADEQLCPGCFLLVRQNAPICPVGDDDCPLFS